MRRRFAPARRKESPTGDQVKNSLRFYEALADSIHDETEMKGYCYIAGPISDGERITDRQTIVANCEPALRIFTALARAGVSVVCPHFSAFPWLEGRLKLTHAEFLSAAKAVVQSASGLILIAGQSAGARTEESWADKAKIPILFLSPTSHPDIHNNDAIVAWAKNITSK